MDESSSDLRPKNPEQGPGNRLKMIFVEDEPMITRLAKAFLETVQDLDLTTCESAEEAQQLLQEAKTSGKPYDLVISDRGLKGKMTGVDFYKIIAADQKRYGNPTFAFLSGNPGQVKEELPEFEINGGTIMAKPFSLKVFKEYVNAVKFLKLSRPQA